MFGVVFHPPSLVNLMVDRERFNTVVVPQDFEEGTQEAMEILFAKKQKGSRRLLLIEGVSTLHKVAALFPHLVETVFKLPRIKCFRKLNCLHVAS